MRGDYSRITFQPDKDYTRVYLQQGRVQLDADWNEQAAIIDARLRSLIRDVIGDAAPAENPGFRIVPDPRGDDFTIRAGHYYVGGLLCRTSQDVKYSQQPYLPDPLEADEEIRAQYAFVYLDVWERSISAVQDPALREVALGGPDTSTRVQTIWQIRLLLDEDDHDAIEQAVETGDGDRLCELFANHPEHQSGRNGDAPAVMVSCASPDAIGDNLLYRVEIHGVDDDFLLIKWSRENASVSYGIRAIEQIQSNRFVAHLQASASGLPRLHPGEWVEIHDDKGELSGTASVLYQVDDTGYGTVTLIGQFSGDLDDMRQPCLRRWDHSGTEDDLREGAVRVRKSGSITLDNGLSVKFDGEGAYQPGDAWVFPLRAEGDQYRYATATPIPAIASGRHTALLALLRRGDVGWHVDYSFHRAVPSLRILEDIRQEAFGALERVEEQQRALDAAVQNLQSLAEMVGPHLSPFYKGGTELEVGDWVAQEADGSISYARPENRGRIVGIIAETDDENGYRIAMYGRVQCKVRDRVHGGQYLAVTKGNSGHLRAATLWDRIFRRDLIVGRALSSFNPERSGQVGMVDIVITRN